MCGSLRFLFLLNIADILLTKHLVDLGATELNPIIDYLLSVDLLWALIFKVALIIIVSFLVLSLEGQSRSARPIITGANVFFVFLITYQLVGVVLLS